MKIPIVPVVMCTWRRIAYLPLTIKRLAAQRGIRPHLYIWNNNPDPAERKRIDAIAASASFPITVRHSDTNVGGFGRFYFARELALKYRYIVFIDDDQLFDTDTIATLWREAQPHTVHSWWAYNFYTGHSYWFRSRARKGGRATYLGTCGMVADSSLFLDKEFFNCPKDHWFIEDLWLSYYAEHVLGWTLRRSKALFKFIPDGKNQAVGLLRKKSIFLRHLHGRGWRVGGRALQPFHD